MSNEVIGIASVFGVVFVLFILRQIILTIGRENGQHLVAPSPTRATHESKKSSYRDNAWSLWMLEPDQADSANGVFDELAKRRAQATRRVTNQPR